mmetsp:Transcript_140578/g.356904  ORF Transcript_140578/g.356904 Transcript_140578/m.356904 type:complete len:490 (+) Transcript_140578:60-1529(+)|eukprot:CAMPEP_0115181852 /NCGR_PEP_ID=MMETSP0270-20121206/7643_1 /TAXON_ID=71861 /ORGANISM="Scrippsiella trochoidea, Strain CCMP3099" /LENGTH=489 /DNA_ID=CAMNT_0002594885 /DNA_START=68 /DNA_END=1537 /DNA_ORIENTATION=+
MCFLVMVSTLIALMSEALGELGTASGSEAPSRRFRGVAHIELPTKREETITAEDVEVRIFELVKMERRARSDGAVCLDGSPGAFYISKAPAEYRTRRQWVIHLAGGSWCYDAPTCYNRSVTVRFGQNLGSSVTYLPNQTAADLQIGGMLSDNCTENPTFCNFNFVFVKYCDGTSYSGNREDPIVYMDSSGMQTKLWFRGRRILNAVLDTLIEDYGLGSASEILLGGDSAGGLAVFNHANYVQRRIQHYHSSDGEGVKFRVAPNSGFFLYHNNVAGDMVWQEQMKHLYQVSNWTLTDNACLEMYVKELQWLCIFPQNLYKFIEPSIFVLNSALDLYQVSNILAAERIEGFPNRENSDVSFWSGYNSSAVPGWANCSGVKGHIENCGPEQIYHINAYMDRFTTVLSNDRTFQKRGNGAFVYGCFDHNAEMRDLPQKRYSVGSISMRDALSAWWRSASAPAQRFTHVEVGRYKYPASMSDASPSCSEVLDPF